MASVLQMTRVLHQQPIVRPLDGVTLRTFRDEADIAIWLELRRRAFARQKLGVRDWDEADFRREFLQKPWWRPEGMWFAEITEEASPAMPIGSVTLARRGDSPDARPVVHWLVVLPSFRRHGIGHMLMATLESAAWDAGFRQIWLETHAKWVEAVRLYEALGYETVDAN